MTDLPPPIKLAENTISEDEIRALAAWLLEGHQLTKGPLVRKFEENFARYVGTKHSVLSPSRAIAASATQVFPAPVGRTTIPRPRFASQATRAASW